MKPEDIVHLVSLSAPAILADGSVIAASSRPDLETNRYTGHVLKVTSDGVSDFTHGSQDSSPVTSPDGQVVVFIRPDADDHGQLHALPTSGGDARLLCTHPLGAQGVVFSPDGTQIAYTAAVPEPGRYGTDKDISAAAEAPRTITSRYYRRDGVGFTLDKPKQAFVLTLAAGSQPRQLTAEPGGVANLAWSHDGSHLYYDRPVSPEELRGEIAVVPIGADQVVGTRAFAGPADFGGACPAPDGAVYFLGLDYVGDDFPGRSLGLWRYQPGAGCVRLTDAQTVHVDASAGPLVLRQDHVLFAVENRGAVGLYQLPMTTSEAVPLAELTGVVTGHRVVKSFASKGNSVACVVATPDSPAELLVVTPSGEQVWTDLGQELRACGIRPMVELAGQGADGYPVHGWLVLPDGDGPHPVLLNIHGGPHTQYGWGLFDEAQVYASAGYAVVLGNPRGGSGYGQQHGRAVVHDMGQVDTADILALLDCALAHPDCDGNRVGVMGGSYGGYMTSHIMGVAGERFVAGISERAVNVWDSFAGSSDIGAAFTVGYVGSDRDEQWRRSPLAAADQIQRPLLIVHSENDWRCPLEQAQRLYTALKCRDAEVEMVLFPGEGHELSRSGRPLHRVQRFAAILRWWSTHLPVAEVTEGTPAQ